MHKKHRIIWSILLGIAVILGLWCVYDGTIVFSVVTETREMASNDFWFLVCTIFIKLVTVFLIFSAHSAHLAKIKNDALTENNRELDALTANIPGGFQRCLDDEFFTMIYMSDGFLSMTGFTAEEIKLNFDNKYINMIFPADRERVMKEIAEIKNENFELQYRLIKKDGSTLWILDKGQLVTGTDGVATFYCVLVDINKLKQTERQLIDSKTEIQLSNERYQIIMNQSDSIIFEYDILNKTVMYSGNFKKKFGFDPLTTGFPEAAAEEGLIHPDDTDRYLEFFRNVELEDSYNEGEFRLTMANGSYAWFEMKVTTIRDENGKPLRAIGRLTDITKQKAETQKLIARSETDTLTGLYNKATTQNLIENSFKAQYNSQHAVLMLDVDDFKNINDTFGHGFGDSALTELACKLKGVFRSSDIVGRIGGDEFMILMKDLKAPEMIAEKASDICKALLCNYEKDGKTCTISASVGVAVFPQDGTTYDELYKKADTALYRAKSNGKNNFMFYNDRSER